MLDALKVLQAEPYLGFKSSFPFFNDPCWVSGKYLGKKKPANLYKQGVKWGPGSYPLEVKPYKGDKFAKITHS